VVLSHRVEFKALLLTTTTNLEERLRKLVESLTDYCYARLLDKSKMDIEACQVGFSFHLKMSFLEFPGE
jgi:hypothetical protein